MAQDKDATVRTYITLPTPLADQLDAETKDGLPMVRLLSRLAEWYLSLPESVKDQVRRRDGDVAAELIRQRLGEIAAAKVAKSDALLDISADEAIALIPLLVQRIETDRQALRVYVRDSLKEDAKKITQSPKKRV